MAETIDLVYIGDKPEKKDTAYGTHLVFPKGQAIPVPIEFTPKFLRHKDVWVKASDYADVKKQQEADAQAKVEAAAKEEAERLAKLEAENLVVEPFGDLGKATGGKLKALVESESLGIEIQPGELVREFAYRVRDALKAKQASTVTEAAPVEQAAD